MNLKSRIKHTWIYSIYKGREINQLKNKIEQLYPDNDLVPMKYFDISIISVGKHSYGELNLTTFDNKAKLRIGNFVSIAQNVSFILDAEHYVKHLSTYPFKVKIAKCEKSEAFSKGDIIIDDDVWIGYGATIMSGVHIGQGAIVAAGAVVTADVEPYAIVGGIPAKFIKFRFNKSTIEYLLGLDYSSVTAEMIQKHISDLYVDIDEMGASEIEELFSWFPRKCD